MDCLSHGRHWLGVGIPQGTRHKNPCCHKDWIYRGEQTKKRLNKNIRILIRISLIVRLSLILIRISRIRMKQGILDSYAGCALHKGPVSEGVWSHGTHHGFICSFSHQFGRWKLLCGEGSLCLTCTKTLSGPAGTLPAKSKSVRGYCRHPGKTRCWLGLEEWL